MTAAVNAGNCSAVAACAEPKTSAFVDALNRRHRRRKPPARSHGRKAPGPSYAAAARLQPKMWTGGVAIRDAPAQEARRKIIRKRPSREIGKSVDDRGHREADREATVTAGRPAKKPCRVSPPPSRRSSSPSFLRSDLLCRRYGGLNPLRKAAKAVTFASPLVTDAWTRPRTRRADVVRLFYNRADEARFRKELRLERRLRLPLSVESYDEDDCRAGEAEAKATVRGVVAATCDEMEEDPNEVTESDDSSDSEEESGSSDDEND